MADEWGGHLSFESIAATVGGPRADVEVVGPHLRVGGQVDLGRFTRLSDRINHGRGYILLHNARLLKRNGDPTPLVVAELYVNQDEVTFIAVSHVAEIAVAAAAPDRPLIEKRPRRYVMFTPGHVISGQAHVYHEMSLAGFADSTDPRFIAMTHVSARSLADRRVVSHFDLLLVNRTQLTAVAEAEPGAGRDAPIAETDVPIAETDAPIAETDVPIADTDAAFVEADVPVLETDAAFVETDVPFAETP